MIAPLEPSNDSPLAPREDGVALWLAPFRGHVPRPVAPTGRRVVVAIPARDEAVVIGDCLAALAAAARFDRRNAVTALVLVNNTTDDTLAIVRQAQSSGLRVVVQDRVLPAEDAHAGGARRAAMDAAAALADPDTVLMTTDADSRVAPDWIAANLGEIAQGVDAVAGMIGFDPPTCRRLQPILASRAAEWTLAERHARLGALLDPRPYDPWPTHIWAWGASLAITARGYARVGGVPSVPLCEDRALAAAIEAHDLKLRHSHAPLVFTSARAAGRAPGGFADLVAGYAADRAMVCDAALEPVAGLVRRLKLRARACAAGPGFGARWAAIEAHDPLLERRRVWPDMLDRQIAACDRVIAALSRAERHRADIAASARAA